MNIPITEPHYFFTTGTFHVSCSVKLIFVLMENERRSEAGGCLSVYAVRKSRSL